MMTRTDTDTQNQDTRKVTSTDTPVTSANTVKDSTPHIRFEVHPTPQGKRVLDDISDAMKALGFKPANVYGKRTVSSRVGMRNPMVTRTQNKSSQMSNGPYTKPSITKAAIESFERKADRYNIIKAQKKPTVKRCEVCGKPIRTRSDRTACYRCWVAAKGSTGATIAKVECKKFMSGCIRMIRVTKLSGFLDGHNLPVEYMDKHPFILAINDDGNEYVSVQGVHSVHNVSVGTEMTYKEYGEIVRIMKEAGQRLTDINKRAKEAEEWSGEFKVSI